MNNLEDKVEFKKGKKGFWESLWKKRRLDKPGVVAVIYLKENGNAEKLEVKTNKGFFSIAGRTYHEKRDCTYTMMLNKERYPLAIIPEWNLTPLGTKEWEDKAIQEKFAILQDDVMKGIRHAERVRSGESSGETKVNAKLLISGAIAAAIVIAVIMGYS